MKKILSICLIVCFLMSFAMPVMAAEGTNLAKGANVTLIGYNTASDDTKDVLVNGLYATDDTTWNHENNWNGKHAAFVNRYNADGDMTTLEDYKTPPYVEGYPYYSMIILELENAGTVDTFRMVATDPDFGIGEFRLQEFDILVSATGEAGSWKVAHEARETRDNDSWVYVEEGEDLMWPHWVYEADLGGAENIKYVTLAVTMLCNHTSLSNGQFVNLLELEVIGNAGAAAAEDTTVVVEDTTVAVEDTTVAVEDTTVAVEDTTVAVEDTTVAVEDTTVAVDDNDAPATFDFVIVPVVALAAAAAGAVVLKKKN